MMVKLGWLLTIYICLSLAIFLSTSNTINGWIIYGLLLLPFYATILLCGWIHILQNRAQKKRMKYWIWSIALTLQGATILASPGNCFGVKQGDRCYSNLQIWFGNVPSLGPSNIPHWKLVEDAFIGLLIAYGVAVVLGLSRTLKASSIQDATESD